MRLPATTAVSCGASSSVSWLLIVSPMRLFRHTESTMKVDPPALVPS
jgi:hypothetical protein